MYPILFYDTATTVIYTLSLHDALPISFGTVTIASNADGGLKKTGAGTLTLASGASTYVGPTAITGGTLSVGTRSEEHTSELQSRVDLVCRLLLEKKKKINRSARSGLCS